MKKESLIGKEIYGFKFGEEHLVTFSPGMEDYVGKIGVIESHDNTIDAYSVHFKDDYWWYPEKLIENYLVTEEKIDLNNLFTTIKKL